LENTLSQIALVLFGEIALVLFGEIALVLFGKGNSYNLSQ
jgi:hypothetical protein